MIGAMDLIPASVLVIENHPLMREALCNAISEEPDLDIVEPVARDGKASQIVIPIKPDLLLLDRKPDLILLTLENSGAGDLETMRLLQTTLPGVPILLLTSSDVPGQEQTALESGAQAVLTKAVGRAELICNLRELRTKAIQKQQQVDSEGGKPEPISQAVFPSQK
jgi:two-component system nitrate/nitrite response regulator NarL